MHIVNTNYLIDNRCSFRDLTKLGNSFKTMSTVTLEHPQTQEIPNLEIRSAVNATVQLIRYHPESFEIEHFGSGFFFHPNGWVLSAQHVVSNRDVLIIDQGLIPRIKTVDELLEESAKGNLQFAKVTNTSPELDLALLKIAHNGPFPFLCFEDKRLQEGEYCHSIGMHGIRTGQVLANLERDCKPLKWYEYLRIHGFRHIALENIRRGEMIETTLPVEHGDSGGPLVNSEGNVVGLTQNCDQPTLRLNDFLISLFRNRKQRKKNESRTDDKKIELPITAHSHFGNLDRIGQFFNEVGLELKHFMKKNRL